MTRMPLVAAVVLLSLAAAARTLTLTPTAHNFGKVAIGGGSTDVNFRITGLVASTDSLQILFNGTDPTSFIAAGTGVCGPNIFGDPCTGIQVSFFPRTLGPTSATLQISDKRGNRATARLTGEGVAPLCTNRVVFCNYAHLYSGQFSWRSSLAGPNSQYSETVLINVVNGVATCEGSVTETERGESRTTSIAGEGLIAVEFVRDETYPLVYRVSGACPSPWGGGPAEMGDNSQESYKQPATNVGMPLVGCNRSAHPDTDALNGVSGSQMVSWSLQPGPPSPAETPRPVGPERPPC